MLKTLLIQNVFSKADPMQIALFYIGRNMLHTKNLLLYSIYYLCTFKDTSIKATVGISIVLKLSVVFPSKV